jgi:peptidoglycan/xylan/chitin deacetylase (PgdA/CDA1 family)
MRWIAGAAGLGLGMAAVHAAPALAWIDPLRCHLMPRLAGLGDTGHLALTFDDGPDPASTPQFLEQLDGLGWRATFFLLGSMTDANPGLAADIVAAGHEVAVHGYDHVGSLRRTPGAVARDLDRAIDVVTQASGRRPRWYRPPFGELSAGALLAGRRAGVETVLWSAWGRDWRPDATPASVINDLRGGVLAGGTVLLHDSDCVSAPGSWKTTLATLPLLAEVVDLMGLRVGPLVEHR